MIDFIYWDLIGLWKVYVTTRKKQGKGRLGDINQNWKIFQRQSKLLHCDEIFFSL